MSERRKLGDSAANDLDETLMNMFSSLETQQKNDIVSHYFTRKLVAERLKDIMGVPPENIPPEPLLKNQRHFTLTASMVRAARVNRRRKGEWMLVYEGISPADSYELFDYAENGDTIYLPEELSDTTLVFEARFESGNLWSAIKVSENEYNLRARPDWNTASYTQWYFFAIGNTRKGMTYKFNFVNMLKDDSLYNYGMKPLAYSCSRAKEEGLGWHRIGRDITYFRSGSEYTFTFTFTATHHMDTIFFAYCYPYTYSQCKADLKETELSKNGKAHMGRKVLCNSLQGRPVDILTITEDPKDEVANAAKKIVLLTGRCHPGESNSSWMFRGAFEFLLSDDKEARELRRRFVFLCVPMLNPDGVYLGNYRCSFAGCDLNRQWRLPSEKRHPVVYSLKKLILELQTENRVMLCTDLHGHSKKMNVFMYGCRNEQGVGSRKNATREMLFPFLLSKKNDNFSFARCQFAVTKSKTSTYRYVFWKEASIEATYTMEASFGGARDGKCAGQHFNQRDLMDLGRDWCRSVLEYSEQISKSGENVPNELELNAWLDQNPDVQQDEEEESFDESTEVKTAPKPNMLVDLDVEKRRASLETQIKNQKEEKERKVKLMAGAKKKKKSSHAQKPRRPRSTGSTTRQKPIKFQTARRAKDFSARQKSSGSRRKSLSKNFSGRPQASNAATLHRLRQLSKRRNSERNSSVEKDGPKVECSLSFTGNDPYEAPEEQRRRAMLPVKLSLQTQAKSDTLRRPLKSPKEKTNSFSELGFNKTTKAKIEAVNFSGTSEYYKRPSAIKRVQAYMPPISNGEGPRSLESPFGCAPTFRKPKLPPVRRPRTAGGISRNRPVGARRANEANSREGSPSDRRKKSHLTVATDRSEESKPQVFEKPSLRSPKSRSPSNGSMRSRYTSDSPQHLLSNEKDWEANRNRNPFHGRPKGSSFLPDKEQVHFSEGTTEKCGSGPKPKMRREPSSFLNQLKRALGNSV
eukprot:CAMPEP_0184498596 /NCGR_PEP_ID=MMETSP0113_2-20130426/39387_1 /TAXON_ID=91329 /ORGANISM="Norrisiella sphaerica, Strain BC52" /LENGTH=975 /DNA_ID=CAMNT_0026886189 /DNA_START=634 /DNA_END=3561 /DNA_ORIENTATION=-